MSTHSAIILKISDKEYRGIYCHFDGYLSGVGHTLLSHYKSKKKILQLLELGDLKALGPQVEHNTIPQKEATEAFHRDCGEDLNPARITETLKEIERILKEEYGSEYIYVFKNGKWYFKGKVLTKKTKDGSFEG